MIQNIFLVVLGGGIGSGLRYFAAALFNKDVPGTFPMGTLLVNLIGSFLIGLLFAFFLKSTHETKLPLLLITGFCGGFTTFSSFAFENYNFIKTGDYTSFLIYALGSLFLGVLCVFLGIFLGSRF